MEELRIETEASKAHRPKGIPIGIVVLRAETAVPIVVVVPAAVSATTTAAAAATAVSSTASVTTAVRHDVCGVFFRVETGVVCDQVSERVDVMSITSVASGQRKESLF